MPKEKYNKKTKVTKNSPTKAKARKVSNAPKNVNPGYGANRYKF